MRTDERTNERHYRCHAFRIFDMVKPEQDVKTSTQISAAGWCFIRRQKQLSTVRFQYRVGRNGRHAG
jgi:hypothetical protein